jgi:hypothetical protein
MTGTLTTPTIDRWLHLRAAPERVWRALTVPEELAAWFGQRADPREFVPVAISYATWSLTSLVGAILARRWVRSRP